MVDQIFSDPQRPDIGVVVELYDVDATEILGEILRFTPSPLVANPNAPAPVPIIWQGNTYNPRACETSGWAWDGTGPLPTPKLSLGNSDSAISALCISYGDLQGAIVTRHRVPMQYLDGMPNADPTIEFDPDVFIIDQKTTQNKVVVEFSLGAAIDIQGRLIPGRQVIQGYCSLRYRVWTGSFFLYSSSTNACPYTDDPMFTDKGVSTSDPSKDVCSKRINSGCKLRFPTGDLPYGGFPGAARYK